ncbi:MAG: bifunctional heptose 7-phosphate kinase/heptose 1-phosphate adenyltransferase [Bacillota bacterium]
MSDIAGYIDRFSQQKIMVIGDIIADKFVVGRPERLSREAPVLILRHQDQQIVPGGGANASNNIRSLGGQVELVGMLGQDETGASLLELLTGAGIGTEGVIVDKHRPTSLKTRILAGGKQVVKQQVVRIDHLDKSSVDPGKETELLSYVEKNLGECDGILISDYGNGLMTDRVRETLLNVAREQGKIVAVDTRYNLLDYRGATIATPNLEEAGYALGRELETQSQVVEAGKNLIKSLELDYLLITQGSRGMTLFREQGDNTHIPVANFSEVFDVTGAGDTVVGTVILALGAGARPLAAVKMANYAAGIVVRKNGVATVTPEELRQEVIANGL